MIGPSLQLYKNAYSGLSKPVWWLSVVIFINRCGAMVIPFLTVYIVDLGHSEIEAGYVMAAFGAGSIVGGYAGGRLTDRFGFFYVQVFSLLMNGILFIVLGQMQSLTQITVCIFILSSIGECFRPANFAALATYSTEENRTRSYSLNRLAINVGFSIGPAIGGALSQISYQLLFWVDGITCILASLVLFMFFFRDKEKRITKKENKTLVKTRSAWKDRIFLTGMFYIFLVGLCFFQVFTMLPIYFKEQIYLSKFVIGLLLAMNGIIIAFFEMVIVYKLEQKRNPVRYMMLGALFIGMSFLFLNISPGLATAAIAIVIITVGEMFLFPFVNSFWVQRSDESTRGQYAGIYTMSFSAAIVLSPGLASHIAHWFNYPILWVSNFILCCFAATGYYFLRKQMIHERV
jgi:MFS family permease